MNTAKRVWTKLKSYGAPMPVNTLDRDTSNGASSPTSRPIQETTDSPPSKRQRLEQNNHPKNDEDEERRPVPYSNSAFVLRDNIPGATTPQTNEFRGNLSPDAIQPHVTEFERVERLIHPPSPVLGERKIRNGKRQENLVIDLVDDGGSEDPIDLVQPRKKGQPIIESDELAHRFMSKSKGTPKRILANHDSVQTRTAFKVFRKRTRSQSMDELAGDSPTLKKARPINKRIATDLSSSGESQRGHITPVRLGRNSSQVTRQSPTKNKMMDSVKKARHIITTKGLPVKRAVSGNYAYPSPADDLYSRCVLLVHELEREMDNLVPKAKLGYVIRDADVQKPSLPDDILLVEHNQEKRKQQQLKPKPKLSQALISPDTARAKPRIKDDMHPSMSQQHIEVVDSERPQTPAIRQTRAKRKMQSPSPPPPDLWTEKNPDWRSQWRDSLIFPPTGKNRATVDQGDINRLDEGQLLNDNLIIFYLRYLQHDLEQRRPDIAERIYFHNTFFYEKLKPTKGSPGINYDSVKAWTSKVDLFKKDFIVVPINEFSHWYIAIIYNAPKLDTTARKVPAVDLSVVHTEDPADKSGDVADKEGTEQNVTSLGSAAGEVTDAISHMSLEPLDSDHKLAANGPSDISGDTKGLAGGDEQTGESLSATGVGPKKPPNKGNTRGKKHSPDEPKIITLDSLGSGHSPACRNLKDYLVRELKDKKGADMPDPGSLTMTAKGIPTQKNYCDCGVYLLGYVVRFLDDPDAFIRTLLLHENIEWDIDAPALRNDIRTLLFKLQKEQMAREDERVKAKKEAARIRRNRQSRPPSSEVNEAQEPAQAIPSGAPRSSLSPVRPVAEKITVSSPSPVVLVQESVESPEIASPVTTAPKAEDFTILENPKTPVRPATSPGISDRSSSVTTDLHIETPQAMPSSNESDVEKRMLPLLPETPIRSPADNPIVVDDYGVPDEGSENAPTKSKSDIEVVISSREHFERQQKERQKQESANISAQKHPKETARESPFFSHKRARIGGLQQNERVVAATPLPKKKSPEVVNVDDSD
ncbi:hypothetical protein PG989_002520 [Apiospora arundinis]